MANMEYVPSIGDVVWIQPLKKHEFSVPWAGKVINSNQNKVMVTDEENKDLEINCKDIIKPISLSDLELVEDMINLSDLQECSILRNIYLRYLQNEIYTYTGGILVAVNPYKQLNIYGENIISKYQGKRMIELSPHIFAIGAQALANLKHSFQNQSIIISGETGSGKTESTKLLLKFLASSSSKNNVGNKIVQANPILEVFGNARTTKNDNSSRFGKYIEISFGNDGMMRCASIQHYLLEKARIKSQNIGDRNYHIFYSMLEGLPNYLKDKFKLSQPQNYYYLTQGKIYNCEGRDEKKEFKLLEEAFKTLNFTEKEYHSIFQVLAAVLHLGNLTFKAVEKGNEEETQVSRNIHLMVATSLLGVDEKQFVDALTLKTILVEGTKVVSEMSIEQAMRSRDAFAMSLYNNLFSYILTTINKSISDHKVSKSPSIGILDIFGFENFESNSFEQLCINYANEHLQQFFVNHVFKLEQEEYNREHIKWEHIHFQDNRFVLQLLGLNKMSILAILDEQTKFPRGSDKGMILKCNQQHGENPYYKRAKSDVCLTFGVKHYAGIVTYSVEGFIEKNMNTLSHQWREVVRESNYQFLKDLFLKELTSTIKSSIMTLSGQYRQSLDSLMNTLNVSTPFFIRCIKPNDLKVSFNFDRDLVCQQLRCSGMMETAKIRQIGYPIRYTYVQFVLRYRILVPGSPPIHKVKDVIGTSKTICEKYLDEEEYQLGSSKIFLKIPDEKLEVIRDRILTKSAIVLQKNFRATRLRSRFLKIRKATITIQRYWRAHKPRAKFALLRTGYLRLQAVLRSRILKHKYKKMKHQIIGLQAQCRGFLKRKEIENKIKLAKNNKLTVPVPKPRKSSNPELWLDNYITDMFENALNENDISSDLKDYLSTPAANDNVRQILNRPGIVTFQKFAAANFMGNINGKFSRKVLDQPLLDLTSPGDQMAATVIWVTILRFMGILDENVSWSRGPVPRTRKSIMSQLQATISKSFLHSKGFLDVINALKEEERRSEKEKLDVGKKKLVSLTLIHRNKLEQEMQRARLETEALKNSYQEWILGPPRSLLEKLHFIIGHGILRASLRDEIYCQLCKQLSDNPDPVSSMYGWILLSLCSSTFPPSKKLAPTILHFIATSGNMLGTLKKLQRTIENGPRNQPPSAFELSALKTQQRMFIDIILLDDSSINLEVDPSSTAKEIIKAVCSRKNIGDCYGYSIFLSLFGQTLSLESEGWFLMDGICQCEMRASEKGLPEITAPWNVVFRREIFPPWPLVKSDALSIHLTYCQVIKGVSLGEYRCSQECELSLLVAQYYYILYGKSLLPEILDSVIKEVLPEPLQKQKHMNWAKSISDTFQKSYFIKQKIPEEIVKIDIVNFAKKKWPLHFSRYYEITQLSGFYLGSTDLLLAVNSYGIFFVNNATEIILKLHYTEISSLSHQSEDTLDKDQLHITTVRQAKYVFKSNFSETILKHVNFIQEELLSRSKYAVAIDDYTPPDSSFLELSRGDLVVLNDNPTDETWLKGHHVDSGHVGEFPKKLVKILPCTEKPPSHVLSISTVNENQNETESNEKVHSLFLKKHTLESYAHKYFRLDQIKMKGQQMENLWCFSKNKMCPPLHHSLNSLTHLVTPMLNSILHYMGDVTQSSQLPCTRTIFEPPLKHEVLRDELFCLLMKQMTDNPSSESMEKGWELMLLSLSLFSPSSILQKELELWLDTRPCEMSCECLQKLFTVKKTGPRKLAHHWLELSSVQDKIPILHPIIFPNNMEQVFEVDSHTTVNDLVEEISRWLGLISAEGFSLIVVFENNAVSISPSEFLFDAILQACQFPKGSKGSETPKYSYDLMFVKKLWMNTYAGADRTADLVCHYYQELPKYIAGSHNCTVGDAMYLGTLIFMAEQDDNKPSIDPSKEILGKIEDLIPSQLVHHLSHHDWLYGILKAYEENRDMKNDDAKIQFLKVTQNWPNFGSAFFSVHFSSTMQDEQITLVVNRNGLCLVNPFSQEIMTYHGYAEIFGCSYTEPAFSLTVSNRQYTWYSKASRKIADLVNSYLEAFDTKFILNR